MAVDTQEIKGFDDLAKKLREVPLQLRKTVLRQALTKGARAVRDEAKRNAPVLSGAARAPYRTPGLLKRSIAVRTSKAARVVGDVGVFVNVRPAKGARFKSVGTRLFGLKVKVTRQVRASQRGAKSRLDPFYWRFVEFGTAKMQGRHFLQAGARTLPEALNLFMRHVRAWIAKTDNTGRVGP